MVERWNSVVGKEDRIVHGGDFSFATRDVTKAIFDSLNGEKHLVKGNHDGSTKWLLEIGWKSVQPYWYEDDILVIHDPNNLTNYRDLLFEAKTILYGHVHNNDRRQSSYFGKLNAVNICVEKHFYTPKTIEQLLSDV